MVRRGTGVAWGAGMRVSSGDRGALRCENVVIGFSVACLGTSLACARLPRATLALSSAILESA
jgi:hypothetical protein